MLALGACSTVALAGPEIAGREYPLPDHGSLQLQIPTSWRHDVRQPPDRLPPTITLRPAEGRQFEFLITPLWSPKSDKGFNRIDKVRALVDGDRRGLAPSAVEKELVLESIEGPEAHGYYFVATDKAPKPGEFEFVIRAGIGVGDLLLSATILSHEKGSEAVQEALSALRQARHRKQQEK
jgi:hypothetical protein